MHSLSSVLSPSGKPSELRNTRSSRRVINGFGVGEMIGSDIDCHPFQNPGNSGKATEQLKDLSRLYRWADLNSSQLLLPTMRSAPRPPRVSALIIVEGFTSPSLNSSQTFAANRA